MIDLARQMMGRAHAPYSRFHVGAVLKTAAGKLYGGCNVENAAYPQGLCAEASAIGNMVAGGETVIREVLVMAQSDQLVTPCGGCRQRLRAIAGEEIPGFFFGAAGFRRPAPPGGLLPPVFLARPLNH